MPIFEFKCMDCDQYIELLIMNKQDEIEMVCSHCGSGKTWNGSFPPPTMPISGGGSGASANSGATSQTRACSSGSCTTYTIPGP